ncbi:MAG TPA: sugar ABC transporter ATP-binding protein, partial [Spirochaetia bacterium]|nr:sugar ABC transporter ATP-binding protein [Spirochaetia bacterium]
VGARTEIQRTILKLAEGGMSILFISAELSEVVRCCTRVAVLRDRHKLGELHGAEITESALMATIAQG